MALKRYLAASLISLGFLAVCSVAVFGAVLDRDYSSVGAIIAIFVPLAVVFGVAIPASRCKSLRPSNYPRIEHLRIAAKYHAVGTSANMSGNEYHWSMGSSPLDLRRGA